MRKKRKKLLLHICCAPDATYGIEKFSKDYDITLYFYNPNIHPVVEYNLRALEVKRLARTLKIPLIEGPYEPDRWFEAVKGLEDEPELGKRCDICFKMRLEDTAALAKEMGFDAISTVLTISPKKDAERINAIGKEIAKKYGVKWVAEDLKKEGGFQRSLELSAKYELYRQDYCGCIFSKKEVERRREEREREILLAARAERIELKGRPPGSKEELFFIKEARMALEDLGYKVSEHRFEFLGWDPLQIHVEIDGDEHRAFPLPFSSSVKGILKSTAEEIGTYTLFPNIKFRVFRTHKGNLEIYVRESGPAIPFKPNPDRFVNPKISIGFEALEPLRQGKKIKVRLITERKPAFSEVMLSPLGEKPEILITGIADSPYLTVAESEATSAAVLLQLAGRLRRKSCKNRVMLALLGAETLEIGSVYLKKLLHEKGLEEKIRYWIDVRNVGRGKKICVFAPQEILKQLEKMNKSTGVDLIERKSSGQITICLWPDELYRTDMDIDETLNTSMIAKVVRYIMALIEELP